MRRRSRSRPLRPWRIPCLGATADCLAGDQLYVDFDIGVANLPAGSRLRVGTALIEISAKPHTGCNKFSNRFGADALRFVNGDVGAPLRLRGVNARIVEEGSVRTGDKVERV
ncbi:MAG: MOSC domain-containing protein [Acidimicrobiia bacterium]|nr:MOSC domain-containing protein [Acidimicrobiia bacterium]